jgi:hypothetical protein
MAIRSTPDQATRTALNKIKLGGLGGQLTPEDQRRISAFEFIERENARVDAEKNDPYRNLIGQNARTPSAFNAEASADNFLNSMFGQRQPGQISIAPSTAAPKVLTQGMQTPRGNILGRGEFVDIGDSLNAIASPAQSMGPALGMGATPQAVPAQPVATRGSGPILGQAVPNYSQPPIQASILGDRSSVLDRAIAESPAGKNSQLQRDQFQSQQQLIGQKQLFERVSQDVAAGDLSTLGSLPANMRNFALNEAAKTNKELTPSLQQQYLTETDPKKREDIAAAVRLGTTPSPTVADQLSVKSGEQAILSGSKYVEVAKQNYADSSAQFETASTINNALKNPKLTTGFLAKASGTFRNLAESLFGGDFGAAEQEIYKKGVSGFGLAGVRALFRGLGAMSDGDRQRGESTQMSITDPKKSIEYYTEVAKLNQERAREDVNTINKLQRQGVNADEIQRQIEELKMNRPSISDQAYETVFGQTNPAATNDADKALVKKYLK